MRTINEVILNDENVSLLLAKEKLAEAAEYLFKTQLLSRKDIRDRYAGLSNVLIKEIKYSGYTFKVQYNPDRKISTGALTDDQSVKNRPCFLCYNNIPSEQKGILSGSYLILVNPYPVFPVHFTLAHKDHTPQVIRSSFHDMIKLSSRLSPYLTLFYNGPECGASAPDHLHFQAGIKGFLPVENEIDLMNTLYGEAIKRAKTSVSAIDDNVRRIILIKGNDEEEINKTFLSFIDIYKDYTKGKTEPLLNIIVVNDTDIIKVIILLRDKHRPDAFFEDGDKRFFVSPAAADLGGIFITPEFNDFKSAGSEITASILNEVSLNKESFANLKEALKNYFN